MAVLVCLVIIVYLFLLGDSDGKQEQQPRETTKSEETKDSECLGTTLVGRLKNVKVMGKGNRVIFGLIGGLAREFRIDEMNLRLIAFVLYLCTGTTFVLVYCFMTAYILGLQGSKKQPEDTEVGGEVSIIDITQGKED